MTKQYVLNEDKLPVQNVANESMANQQQFFSSYDEFKNFLSKTDGTME